MKPIEDGLNNIKKAISGADLAGSAVREITSLVMQVNKLSALPEGKGIEALGSVGTMLGNLGPLSDFIK